MKAIKKPVEIEFEKFTGTSTRAKTEEVDLGGGNKVFKIWNQLHNSWIEIKLGDFINVENPDDTYPVDAEYFEKNYTVTQD